MTLMTGVFLVAGLVLLVSGAEILVRGAARLAAQWGIPPLVIGLTVVAFGTSAPETAVSTQSAWLGSGDLATGNVLGSNIANVLLILGITAAIMPLRVSRQLIRVDVPLMIGASLFTYGLAWDGQLSRWDGALLFSGILAYTAFLVMANRNQPQGTSSDDEFNKEFAIPASPRRIHPVVYHLGYVFLGLTLLVIGSDFLVTGATTLARLLGLSELVIGLTVVAIGTSLPELATSVMAALRGERDIAVGNIIGSNLFNLLFVLGTTALVAPQPISISSAALAFDFPVMIGVALACLPIFFVGYCIHRWEGWLFLGYYLAYTTYLILSSTGRPFAQVFGEAVLWYALPLTVLTLMIFVWRAWSQPSAE